MGRASLPEERRREVEELATARRAQGRPPQEIAAQIVGIAGITRLWAWRLAMGWRRSELLERLRRLGDPSVDESMVWRWEIGERDPSREHLDRLCQVYQTRPDLLGYGHDYSRRPATVTARPNRLDACLAPRPAVAAALQAEPLAMVQALTVSGVSAETLAFLERSAERLGWSAKAAGAVPLDDMARQYRAVRTALWRRQRVEERRRLARVAARLGGQLGLALWERDGPVALAYFDASQVAAEEAGDDALAAWVAERRGGGAGG
ncbi:MAG TPA: helix-turn-helix transcriptional regulator [Actinomycetes bacterium]|jgi:transcriptional regulator with XRE-family HTH domain|nr:helix-turn-helix transcriptional regulator [Actinomycetes bacterium]